MQTALAEGFKLLNDAAPTDSVVKIKALEAFAKAADGKATKIIIPSEIQGSPVWPLLPKKCSKIKKRERPAAKWASKRRQAARPKGAQPVFCVPNGFGFRRFPIRISEK